jgi:hypothetical protein
MGMQIYRKTVRVGKGRGVGINISGKRLGLKKSQQKQRMTHFGTLKLMWLQRNNLDKL